ncbi:tyrosine-type recombinase/integrase [Sphingopyxis sp. GC21]|uniref:tyrosine-type recombinase/integrase n=1 Tax=Sphingopyxis sp. GC21 TaxID=2933562 RepID=UPI0021E3DD6E|nr:site-specific integrase [Sphingopyxis sp. GC21]
MSAYPHADTASLFTPFGQRKYLCQTERARFADAANHADRPTRLFALVLLFTGCRISEALETTPLRLDSGAGCLIIRTLKRRRTVYRAVPIPKWLLEELINFGRMTEPDMRLWSWCRQTAWRHIHALMEQAHVEGPMACPRGLRHGFGIRAADKAVTLNLVQKWMGHASPDTTAIYLNAVGIEERQFARRMW